MAGLRTGMPRRSDWTCMRRPFCDMPPSASRLLLTRPRPLSDSIASKISLKKKLYSSVGNYKVKFGAAVCYRVKQIVNRYPINQR